MSYNGERMSLERLEQFSLMLRRWRRYRTE